MKAALALLLFFAIPIHASHAAEAESRFHLLSTQCEPEASDGPETTPQSPPLNVDDPSTPGCNRWEINVLADGDVTSGHQDWDLPLLDVNYGVGDNLQLKYELPYLNRKSDDGAQSAVGESKAGIKYLFFEDEKSKTQLAIYPQLSWINENADAVKKGLTSSGTITTLPLLLSTRLGATSRGEINLTANIGYNLSSKADTANFLSGAVGVGMPLLDRVGMMGEIATEQALSRIEDESREQVVKANAGLVGTLGKQFLLFGSVGRSLVASDSVDHFYTVVGFRVLADGPSFGSGVRHD